MAPIPPMPEVADKLQALAAEVDDFVDANSDSRPTSLRSWKVNTPGIRRECHEERRPRPFMASGSRG